jgi:hypothetical protein
MQKYLKPSCCMVNFLNSIYYFNISVWGQQKSNTYYGTGT